MKKILTLKKNETGQSLVELALSLTVILMLLTGAVEFGLGLFQYVTIRDAAQEAALYGSIHPLDTNVPEMKLRAESAAADVMDLDTGNLSDPQSGDIKISWAPNNQKCEGLSGTPATPNSLTVTITFAHPITMPFVSAMIGSNTINLAASVTDTILSPTCP